MELPELLGDRLGIERRVAGVERGALHRAGDHHLADEDAVALQSLREQTDELVLRSIADREAHELRARGERVYLRVDLAERSVRHEDCAFRLFQIRERLLDG